MQRFIIGIHTQQQFIIGIHTQQQSLRCFSSSSKLKVSRRLSSPRKMSQLTPEIEEAHRVAVAHGRDNYMDPDTGFTVFTSLAHERRGKCCGRACRHCPFGHFNVPDQGKRKASLPTKPTLLRSASSAGSQPDSGSKELRILFWSGGKDSFLTLLKLMEDDADNEVILLTTFDLESGEVPEQKIPLTDVFDQARALKKDLCVVPNRDGKDGYMNAVLDGIAVVEAALKTAPRPSRLYFGDLHLKDIRRWRENRFAEAKYTCGFPIFGTPYPSLIATMFGPQARKYGARYFFSAVNTPDVGFAEGDEITREVMEEHLMKSTKVDPFGERGEFHTVVRFADAR